MTKKVRSPPKRNLGASILRATAAGIVFSVGVAVAMKLSSPNVLPDVPEGSRFHLYLKLIS